MKFNYHKHERYFDNLHFRRKSLIYLLSKSRDMCSKTRIHKRPIFHKYNQFKQYRIYTNAYTKLRESKRHSLFYIMQLTVMTLNNLRDYIRSGNVTLFTQRKFKRFTREHHTRKTI